MNTQVFHHHYEVATVMNDDFSESVWVSEADRRHNADDSKPRRSLSRDLLVYFTIAALVTAVWQISRMRFFEAGDDIGYWLGVAGGVMMLLLFSYPLRKHFRFTRNWGRMKWWFVAHMVLGVGGPLLILLHSTFRVGSLNAAVALYSMLAVALSGVIGRFLYARVNRGFHNEQASLEELQLRAGLQQEDARSRLAFAPGVEAQLIAFRQHEIDASATASTYLRQVFVLPLSQWLTYRRCRAELAEILSARAQREGWNSQQLVARRQAVCTWVNKYLLAVTRVAQFRAYERMFSLWHIAHVPFVYLLIISAVVHVAAVHVY